jgi:diguanylate cyclase (GGDEF)-like protein
MLAGFKYILMSVLVVALFALTRSDLSQVRVLAADNSFYTVQIAEVTRLEKELLQFRVAAGRLVRGNNGTTRHEVLLAFDILWSRVNTAWGRAKEARLDVLNDHAAALGQLVAALEKMDPLVKNLAPGDATALDAIETALAPSLPAMTSMNTEAYQELYGRAVSVAESQRAALASLNRFQLVFFTAVVAALILLAINLRRGAVLNRQLMAREAEVRSLAVIDPLTGIHNRRYFDERMRSLDGSHLPEGANLLIVDLDGFKTINDSHGHIVGDLMLREISHRIKQIAGAGTVLARIGGDEFGIVQSGSLDHALVIANSIVNTVRLPVVLPDHILSVGASIGVAALGKGPGAAATLFDEADRALYVAKAKGRNCVVVYQEAEEKRSAA